MTDSRPEWAPASINLDQPSSARVWDYFLGGSHNFDVDRRVAEQAISFKPDMPDLARQFVGFGSKVARRRCRRSRARSVRREGSAARNARAPWSCPNPAPR